MKKLRLWFIMWQLRHYPVSALIPNWFWNLSALWSKKERRLQAGVARTHEKIGASLIKTTDNVDWGEETDSGDPGSYGREVPINA